MALEPAVRVGLHDVSSETYTMSIMTINTTRSTYRMQKVELPPFQRCLGAIRSLRRTGLDALDVANMLDRVSRPVARIITTTGQRRGQQGDETADKAESLHGRDPKGQLATRSAGEPTEKQTDAVRRSSYSSALIPQQAAACSPPSRPPPDPASAPTSIYRASPQNQHASQRAGAEEFLCFYCTSRFLQGPDSSQHSTFLKQHHGPLGTRRRSMQRPPIVSA